MKKLLFICAVLSVSMTVSFGQWTTSGSNIYYDGGNVGIGSATIENLGQWGKVVDIFHGSSSKLVLRTNSIKTGIYSSESSLVGKIGTESSHDLRLMAGYWNDVMTLKTNGNVGIGTTNPSATLDINGGINGGWSTIIKNVGGSGNGLLVQAASGGGDASIMQLRDNQQNIRLQALSNGNIGIGTSSPAYKLDVSGTIRAREIKVDLDGADFVFENDYFLMPLNELEAFIKKNKHLPEIASAKEMEENAVELGKLNAQLLRKIEELTLYTIEQQKEISILKKQNEELEKQNERITKLEKKLGLHE